MNEIDRKLKASILNEVLSSKMTIQRKMKILKMLDKAFREYLGIIYLSDEELEEIDILNRSM